MKTYRVWEGRKGPKGLRKGSKRIKFVGEDIGFWSDAHPTTDERGTAYRVFRTENGEIIVHRIDWSRWTTEDDIGIIYRFPDLNAAADQFRSVLKNAGVLN